jgi:hypothetical protein
MRTIKILAGLLLAGIFISSCGSSKPATTTGGWNFIGDKIADYGIDRDVLWVTNNNEYRQIKLKVTGAPLHIIDMNVYFENGEKLYVELRNNFREGSESRVIDLPGGIRRLKKIEFLYETIGFVKGKARVAVWGYR